LKISPKIICVDSERPQREAIAQAAADIQSGGVVVFPTTGLYGLGTDAMDRQAVERLFEIKKRPTGKPILVLIHELPQLQPLVRFIPAPAEKLINRFWPGQVTLIFPARRSLPDGLTAGSAKIGVRLASHPTAIELLQAVGRPLTGTSANLSDQPGCADISELDRAIADSVDLILDAGRLAGGQGSTIVDVTVNPPVVIREGAVAASRIQAALTKRGKGIDK
jgi:L-threonylcarbamoyladenylate synthase